MINPVYYIYYYMLQITNVFMFGLRKPHYRASSLLAICLILNIACIVDSFSLEIDKYLLIGVIILGIFLSMAYFVNPRRHKRVLLNIRDKNLRNKIRGILITCIYIFMTIIIFIKMRLD